MWQRAFAAKDRKAAKKGMFLGTAVYGVTIVLVYFMGVVGRQILGDDVLAQFGSTDAVVPALAIKILPMGLTGLALAGVLSVIMSTADSYLLVSVQTCVHDIGKTVSPKMTEKTEILYSGNGQRIRSLRRLETGGRASGTGICRAGNPGLRYRPGGGEPCHLPQTSFRIFEGGKAELRKCCNIDQSGGFGKSGQLRHYKWE